MGMLLRDRAYWRGREIGAVADDTDELDYLVRSFLRGNPDAADDDECVAALWQGIGATRPEGLPPH
ncbi:hypothetical protein [Magnetospirillum sp. UT-4]|uniref:hypothetical protein n=1 Tax=Magnetospirillum sp. UT-4 TaxID=2681467 RepID=UPI00137FF0C1|nr:hypothetical protein [Magnetospirillum sp. UT-4]CAA7625786.1 hypothetical protein MTBUT4_70110 [Magnetospirillum sp. UT-4]